MRLTVTPKVSRHLARDERGTEAHGLEVGVDAAVGVMRRPAGRILKEPDGANPAVGAQIEPVVRPARDADQISRLHLDREHRAIGRVDVEEAAAFDDEADLVFVVPMLGTELGEHGVEVWRRRRNVDHIRSRVSAASLQLLNLVAVRLKDRFGAGIGGNVPPGFPSLVRDAVSCQEARDFLFVVDGLLAFRNSYQGHGRLP